MNYEQQLKEILNLKGCGKTIELHDGIQDCGSDKFNNFLVKNRKVKVKLCPTCKAIQQAKKETLLMCAKDELERLEYQENMICKIWEDIRNIIVVRNLKIQDKYLTVNYGSNLIQLQTKGKERISQLQEVIKKLEEMK